MKANSNSKIVSDNKLTLEQSIEKTGYVLEHKVASFFEKAKWSVIHNRYYLDDVTEIQREMDMIAYKIFGLEDDVQLFTALIISCKKNSEFDWAFLTRNAPGMNININMLPVNFNSNQDIFSFQIANVDWTKDKFIKKYDPNSLINTMYNYDRVVFAYQEIRKTNNAPSNDTNIYSSIASLIKAQAYEVASLKDGRKKNQKYIYNINLLSVADLDFHELHFENDEITASSIDRINYLNRFLISSQEQHSKIDFIKLSVLEKAIDDYNTLHEWNIDFSKKLIDDFYANVFKDYNKREFILKKCRAELLDIIKYLTSDIDVPTNDLKYLYLEMENNVIQINVSDNKWVNKFINGHERISSKTAEWLKDNFKYEGKFLFTEDLLPF